MRKHFAKTRYALIGLLAIAVVVLFALVRSNENTRARAAVMLLIPTPDELAEALLRAGLDPQALAAAGLSGADVTALVSSVGAHLVANPGALELADSVYADARGGRDQLQRIIRSGRATDQQISDYPGAQAGIASAGGQRGAVLDGLYAAGTAGLTVSQKNTLAAIGGHRQWDLPLEFLVVDRLEPEWVQLRDCLADERIAAKLGEEPDPQAQADLGQFRSDPLVAAARANLDVTLAVVNAAWEQAVYAQ